MVGGKVVKVAINGFGRIGRCAFKIALERHDIEVVAINSLGDVANCAHLLKYDSVYGIYDREIGSDEENLIIDGQKIPFFNEPDPENLPWEKLQVDVVMECTGAFTKPEAARKHIRAGARKVVISAPAKGDGAKTVVLGVNEEVVTADDDIISCASCTTNCIAPVMKILEDRIGVEKAMMTTVHSYTASQKLVDDEARDLRMARAAAINIVPTTTGASKAAALTIPSLKDKFNGLSVRVPTAVVSLADITAVVKRKITKEEINQIFMDASRESYYEGIITTTADELVSTDFCGNSYSAIIDLPLTDVVDGDLIKVVTWYDNEWGYSNRLVELAADFGRDE